MKYHLNTKVYQKKTGKWHPLLIKRTSRVLEECIMCNDAMEMGTTLPMFCEKHGRWLTFDLTEALLPSDREFGDGLKTGNCLHTRTTPQRLLGQTEYICYSLAGKEDRTVSCCNASGWRWSRDAPRCSHLSMWSQQTANNKCVKVRACEVELVIVVCAVRMLSIKVSYHRSSVNEK